MRRPALLLAALTALPACTEPGPTHRSSEHDIVGGTVTDQFPAVGALTYFGATTCTGTLIGPRKVLTAAHCLDDLPASSLSFSLGPREGAFTEEVRVERGVVHPDYDRATLTHDVAYLILAREPTTAEPMEILPEMDSSYLGRELLFVGYGFDDGIHKRGAGTKRQVSIPVTTLHPRSFTYSAPGKNTCQGDSGGPAFTFVDGKPLIAGVTSGGDEHCTDYGYDMRADAYVDFLDVGGEVPAGPTASCGAETNRGRCDGDTLIWCEEGQVFTSDCAEMDMPCGYASSLDIYGCIAPPSSDPCQGETYTGRCDGDTVIWCDGKGVESLACATSCGYVAAEGIFNCL